MPSRISLAPLGLALALVAGPAPGAEPPPGANFTLAETGLTLEPLEDFDFGLLVVTGPEGTVARRPIASGAAIHFAPVDDRGRALPDGAYRWELRLVTEPAAELVQAAEAARERGQHQVWAALEPRLEPEVRRVAGEFRIETGVITARDEPGPRTGPGGLAPAAITISEASPVLLFEDTNDADFQVAVESDTLRLVHEGTTDVLAARSSVVGLFTSTPDADPELHVVDGLPEVRLESPTGIWDMRVSASDFQIFDEDTLFGEIVLEIDKSGANYTLVFDGDVVSTGAAYDGSSRELKRDLAPVPAAEVLETVAALPLYSWSYIRDPEHVRHIGPVAEEFYAAFGLGRDDKHISPLDTGGVALAAIQALAARLEARERQILELERRLEALERSRPSPRLP